MDPKHHDALLGGTWMCDLDEDDLDPAEDIEQMQLMLDELVTDLCIAHGRAP